MKELECPQHYTFIFGQSMAAYFVVSGGILPKFKLIQGFMHVLKICKNEEGSIKMKGLECSQ